MKNAKNLRKRLLKEREFNRRYRGVSVVYFWFNINLVGELYE
jgi:hypothetical protein